MGLADNPTLQPIQAAIVDAGWGWKLSLMLMAVSTAPLAEELFFRGWLWTALRRFWWAVPVMLVTSLTWVGIHWWGGGGWTVILGLLPQAALLSLVRHFCDSVRPTIILHAYNNLTKMIVLAAVYCLALTPPEPIHIHLTMLAAVYGSRDPP